MSFANKPTQSNISWPNWQRLACDFTTPAQLSAFNVQLYVASAPSGQWVVTDDWYFNLIRNNQVGNNLRVDQSSVYGAKDYNVWLYPGSGPTSTGGYTNSWLGLELGTAGGIGGRKFLQVGIQTTNYGPQWFVFGKTSVICLAGISIYNGRGCIGNVNDRVAYGGWRQFELVTYNQGFWIARVYDQNNSPLDVAKIYFSDTRVYRANTVVEEGINPDRTTDPALRADFSFWHPKYGLTLNLNGDPRFWHGGSTPGDNQCVGNVV